MWKPSRWNTGNVRCRTLSGIALRRRGAVSDDGEQPPLPVTALLGVITDLRSLEAEHAEELLDNLGRQSPPGLSPLERSPLRQELDGRPPELLREKRSPDGQVAREIG